MFLSTVNLQAILPACIHPFNANKIKNVAYELSLGHQVYMTDSETGKREVLDGNNTQIKIMPGQFALLLTEEEVTIPDDKIALISIKFSEKIKGLVNVSGFHIDPGFSGKIIFSVYNAGPAPIYMDRGTSYFLMWLCELSGNALPYNGNHKGQKEIPAQLIQNLQGEIASPNALLEQIKTLEKKVDVEVKGIAGVNDNIKWILGITVGLFITCVVKLFSDNSDIKEAIQYGANAKTLNEEIQILKIDSVFLKKIDSTIAERLRNGTTDQ